MSEMRQLRKIAVLGLVTVAVAAAPADAAAQDAAQQQARAGGAELTFDREVFVYPRFTRRNPFLSLVGADGGAGPRFESLTLIGIMYSPTPGLGVAVVSTGGVTVNPDGTMSPVEGDSWNLKVGEQIGNTTVVEIRRDAVVVDVEVFDQVERHTMTFVSRREGGTP